MRVEYALTAKGQALEPAVRALKVWARSWLLTPCRAPVSLAALR